MRPTKNGEEGMNENRLNCWEFMKCERQPGGLLAEERGVCPAAIDTTHDGKNGGRCCWVIAGTFCEGEIQGTFAVKYDLCKQCDFYALVKEEEHPYFKLSATILNAIQKKM